mmetsp:Transcript_1630/g.3085  ORF Transcript_1630/g.3085 Transcript_1630/m.3085 type:complete len:395 (+) Transcript_1630:33-1217(+)
MESPPVRGLSDTLANSSSSADYQRKMAKAMRVRSERHDQAISVLKNEHQAEVAAMTNNFRMAAEADERRHQRELSTQNEEAMMLLEKTLDAARKEKDDEWRRVLDEMRHELEEDHSNRLSAVITQNQETLRGANEQHAFEVRERMSQIAQQKDDLHEGDKKLALKEAARQWEGLLEERVKQVQEAMTLEHDMEIEGIRRECEASLRDLAAKHAQERLRLGGDMLDQREETRLVVAKSEKEKSQKKLDELRESLEVQFAAKEDAMHHEMLAELTLERSKFEEEKHAALKNQAAEHAHQIEKFECSQAEAKNEFEHLQLSQLAQSGRITEKLQVERDELALSLALAPKHSRIDAAKTIVYAVFIALIGLVASYSMVMIFEYREWLFYANSVDKRFD